MRNLIKIFTAPIILLMLMFFLGINKEIHAEIVEIHEIEDSIFLKKVASVQEYMEKAVRAQGFSVNDIKLSSSKMVELAQEHDFDLPLLMAQAHLESCFGMTKRAKKTNSVFSVGSYDSGKDACVYSSQNECIASYIILVKENYLDGKTVEEMLRNGNFVNKSGMRYATSATYESSVRKIRNKIIKNYPELI